VLTLKRLCDQGEPELALIGLVALVEWLLKQCLPKNLQRENKRQNSLGHVLKESRKFFQAPDSVWDALEEAIENRHFHVHEKPTNRVWSYDPAKSGMRDPYALDLFNKSSIAAIEVFKATNKVANQATD